MEMEDTRKRDMMRNMMREIFEIEKMEMGRNSNTDEYQERHRTRNEFLPVLIQNTEIF